eukprot:GHVQ01000171.1.p2 GENE.GHVQ01000171.1~~GHVQ01000171.1.p2  ORF type:complete len:102 (-),score=18.67 GHVQ01000171.1:112-417(-)
MYYTYADVEATLLTSTVGSDTSIYTPNYYVTNAQDTNSSQSGIHCTAVTHPQKEQIQDGKDSRTHTSNRHMSRHTSYHSQTDRPLLHTISNPTQKWSFITT